MRKKQDICIECQEMRYIYAKKLCQYHYNLQRKKPVKIRQVSPKREKENKEYSKLRLLFLDKYPICQARIIGCTYHATQIHHKEGRIGDLLTDINKFLAVCHHCHSKIELNPEMAKKKGFSSNRL